jgi:hypothetical protein
MSSGFVILNDVVDLFNFRSLELKDVISFAATSHHFSSSELFILRSTTQPFVKSSSHLYSSISSQRHVDSFSN